MKTIARAIIPLIFWTTIAAAPPADDLPAQLRELDTRVLKPEEQRAQAQFMAQDASRRLRAANQRETAEWKTIDNREKWERYRDQRVEALRQSLRLSAETPKGLTVHVTKTLDGDGFKIENLVFESRRGLWVTANLYRPAKPQAAMPGILICHSHHSPKTQGELQDMGMTWARQGCLVLVMDQLGHGERRQHPFVDDKSYPRPFRRGRQDYYFRYNVGIQLHLVGESLMGWMVWDLMRGVDLLLSRSGIDKNKIILLGAVAGGGDPAGVTAAVDPRIAAVVPFNFGGPQPETTFPLPEDAEDRFNYAGGGSWESTRNLRLSARDGFLPWLIVGSVAPRRLIHAHEFAWDQERDPVWKRYQKIYGFYDAEKNLAFTHGRGKLSGQPPESSHCNNIGPLHREGIYRAFKEWFDMPVPDKEFQKRRTAEELMCLTPDLVEKIKPKSVHELASLLADEQIKAARRQLVEAKAKSWEELRRLWVNTLAEEDAKESPPRPSASSVHGNIRMVKEVLDVSGAAIPFLMLLPADQPKGRRFSLVIGLSQTGKQEFLKHRADEIAELLHGGVAVCLPDLRGTGETKLEGGSRGRQSSATSVSSTDLMLGRTEVGLRLRDLLIILRHARQRTEVDAARIALWGESFAEVNKPDQHLQVPLDAENFPAQSEPLGGSLALLGALYSDAPFAVAVRGGLISYHSVLQSPFLYLPHDAVIPGVLTAGDLPFAAALLAPRPLRLEGMVDGLNRRVSAKALAEAYEVTTTAYRMTSGTRQLLLEPQDGKESLPKFFLRFLKSK